MLTFRVCYVSGAAYGDSVQTLALSYKHLEQHGFSLASPQSYSSIGADHTTFKPFITTEIDGLLVYLCRYNHCGKKFPNKYKFERHVKIHTGEKPFKCRFCEFRNSRKDHMKQHELRMHFELYQTYGVYK